MKPIRASEIGSYLYCARAWWYQRNGYESSNLAGMAAGTQNHLLHGRRLWSAGIMRSLGVVSLILSLLLLAAFYISQIH